MSTQDASTFDLIVLGGGAGGLTVVDQALQAGLRVALVERDRPGGDCTYYGCVPTKTLLTTAKLLHQMRRGADFGLPAIQVTPDFGSVMAHMRTIVAEVSANGSFQPWEERGVHTFVGAGRFVSKRELVVRSRDGHEATIRGGKFVIATGSEPEVPSIRGLRDVGYLTNVDMLALTELPRHLIVIGGGPIGVEFAQLMRRLGSDVTIVELKGHILPREDEEAALLLQECLADDGVRIVCGTDVADVRADRDQKVVTVVHEHEHATDEDRRREVRGDAILVATGRRATTTALNLDAAAVRMDEDGWIEVDDRMRTSAANVWAVGDVVRGPKFTHLADYHARIAVHAILGRPGDLRADYRVLPWVTFTDPELGRVGLTEAEAIEAGHRVAIGRTSFADVERAKIQNETRGTVKIVAERGTGQILGATVLGPSGGELIHELALAMRMRIPVAEVFHTIHAYPTLSEAVRWAAEQAASVATPSALPSSPGTQPR